MNDNRFTTMRLVNQWGAMILDLPLVVLDRMKKIQNESEEIWDNNTLGLMKEAERQLKEEGVEIPKAGE